MSVLGFGGVGYVAIDTIFALIVSSMPLQDVNLKSGCHDLVVSHECELQHPIHAFKYVRLV